MRCKCGYEGDPEYGEFVDPDFPLWKVHIRCPMCLKTRHIIIEVHEHVKMAILYPEYCYGSPDYGRHEKTKKEILILKGMHLDGYSIYCPLCSWGEGGGLDKDHSKELSALLEKPPVDVKRLLG